MITTGYCPNFSTVKETGKISNEDKGRNKKNKYILLVRKGRTLLGLYYSHHFDSSDTGWRKAEIFILGNQTAKYTWRYT